MERDAAAAAAEARHDAEEEQMRRMSGGLEALPEELLVYVLTFPSPSDLRALVLVSKSWKMRLQANDAALWRPLALRLWSSSSSARPAAAPAGDASKPAPGALEMERLKQAMDREHGPTAMPWCRFHRLLEAMERNWARLAFTRRHWHHSKEDALTLRYSVDELVRWEEEHDDESEEPEGWEKSSVGALDVDVGGRIVTGGDDGSVRVWDACGSLHGSYTDEWNWNTISCVCHDDQVVVGAYSDRPVASKTGVLVWDLATGEQKQKIPSAEEVKDLALRAPFIVGACGDILCWDLNKGTVVQTLECSYPMEQIEFHPTDANMLLTGSIWRNKVWLWDVRVPKKYVGKATLRENLSPPFAFDSNRLVAGEVDDLGEGGSVQVWDIRRLSKPLLSLREPANSVDSTGDVYAVGFDSEVIVSSHEVGGIRLWSMADGALIAEENSLPLVTHIAVDRDQGRCFVGGDDGGIYFIDLHKEALEARERRALEGEPNPRARRRLCRPVQEARVIEPPVSNGGTLDFADVTHLQITRRGLAASFRDSSVRFYDFAPPPPPSTPLA